MPLTHFNKRLWTALPCHAWNKQARITVCLFSKVLAQSRETRGPRRHSISRGVLDATGAQERAPKLRQPSSAGGAGIAHEKCLLNFFWEDENVGRACAQAVKDGTFREGSKFM